MLYWYINYKHVRNFFYDISLGIPEIKPLKDWHQNHMWFTIVLSINWKVWAVPKNIFNPLKGEKYCNNESFPPGESQASSIFYIKSQDHEEEGSD